MARELALGKEIGGPQDELERMNRKAIGLMEEVREEFETDDSPFVISGNIGPQDDGYNPTELLSADEAQEYHSTQINVFADTAADMVTTMTMTYADEAIGIARAAKQAGMPSAISFTVETDGKLPNGQALGDAIGEVEAATDASPAYYMINCAHPTHFEDVLDGPWRERVRGPACERIDAQPRRARRGRGPRRRRPARPGPPLRGATRQAPGP